MLQSLFRPVLRPIMMGVMSVTGSRRALTPAALFTPGTAGFCGGMSVTEAFDAGMMFQDSVGTAPAALEQPVGLVLGQVGGIDASQTTTTKRPKLSARVNVLTKTEDFSDAYWTRTFVASITSGQTDPIGGTAADLIQASASIIVQLYQIGITLSDATSYVGKCFFKAGTSTWAVIDLYDIGGGDKRVWFDLSNGTVGAEDSGCVGAIDSVGGGWYLCSITRTVSSVSGGLSVEFSDADGSISVTPGKTMYIWGADLRPANEGSTLPAYQRVNTATDYDSVGFPKYLEFEVDDCFVTPSIDLTGTDKVTVFTGVRKLSDAAAGAVAAFGDVSAADGTFEMLAPASAAANYGWSAKGTTLVSQTPTTYAEPISNVITTSMDVAGPASTIRINGTVASTSSSSLGTGNLANVALSIGSVGGASKLLNGRMYTLPIVVGRAVEPALIAEVEAHINAAMGGIY